MSDTTDRLDQITAAPFPRRDFLKAGGALLIGFSLGRVASGQNQEQQEPDEPDAVAFASGPNQPDRRKLNTWLAVHSDNTATIFLGFVELGQGCSTALLQIAAEELDLEMRQVQAAPLDTSHSPNQGGTVASSSIHRGGPRIRAAAAEARQVLLQLASKKLNVPVRELEVSRGIVSTRGLSDQRVSYGELVGDKVFTVPFTGKAPLKPSSAYKVVGTRIPRNDIPDIVSGKHVFMQQVRLPGMLHGRIVRPRGQSAYGAGAKVLQVDESSVRDIPGVQVVRKRDFVGVVAPREWDAVRAARQLKVTWDTTPTLPGSEGLEAQMRAARTKDDVILERGNVASALTGAAHSVSRTCFGPYQSHAVFAPNCALADVRPGSALVMCSSQNIYETRGNLAALLGLPAAKVQVQYHEGSGTYGHSCYEDAAHSAAILSQAAGKPVRLQFMRWDEFGWDNYGPAHLSEIRAAIDANGKIVAYEYQGWQHTWAGTETSQQLALGTPPIETDGPVAQRLSPFNLGAMYDIPNMKLINRRVPGINGYLKGSYLRSPLDIAISFTSEQALDELGYMAGMDPFEFRQRNIKDERWLGVLNAVAKAARWTPRKAASQLSDGFGSHGERISHRGLADVVRGRGIALGTHIASYGAAVAEIEVHKQTGRIVATHMYGAIDAGCAVNPGFIENQISGMLVQAASRMLKEEVAFSKTNVTSLDWDSYPVQRFGDCPQVTPIVVQRLGEKSTGGGEEVLACAAAAIANAFFDATGVRMQHYPLTPARVQAALRRA